MSPRQPNEGTIVIESPDCGVEGEPDTETAKAGRYSVSKLRDPVVVVVEDSNSQVLPIASAADEVGSYSSSPYALEILSDATDAVARNSDLATPLSEYPDGSGSRRNPYRLDPPPFFTHPEDYPACPPTSPPWIPPLPLELRGDEGWWRRPRANWSATAGMSPPNAPPIRPAPARRRQSFEASPRWPQTDGARREQSVVEESSRHRSEVARSQVPRAAVPSEGSWSLRSSPGALGHRSRHTGAYISVSQSRKASHLSGAVSAASMATYNLLIRQQPFRCRAAGVGSDRNEVRPIDPPLIVQLCSLTPTGELEPTLECLGDVATLVAHVILLSADGTRDCTFFNIPRLVLPSGPDKPPFLTPSPPLDDNSFDFNRMPLTTTNPSLPSWPAPFVASRPDHSGPSVTSAANGNRPKADVSVSRPTTRSPERVDMNGSDWRWHGAASAAESTPRERWDAGPPVRHGLQYASHRASPHHAGVPDRRWRAVLGIDDPAPAGSGGSGGSVGSYNPQSVAPTVPRGSANGSVRFRPAPAAPAPRATNVDAGNARAGGGGSSASGLRVERGLFGSLVSSCHLLSDLSGTKGAYFVFPNLCARFEGTFRLRVVVTDLRATAAAAVAAAAAAVSPSEASSGSASPPASAPTLAVALTDTFTCVLAREWTGAQESSELSRHFAEQGIKIPIRRKARGND
ncbi:hypothetical protein HK405_009430 [Cladochytrium tenue]|nr:hypothetical protein HK405_009430 [Cladochytrium tenue]